MLGDTYFRINLSFSRKHTHIQYRDIGNSVPEISTLGGFISNLQERIFYELIFDTHPRVYEHHSRKERAEARGHFYVITANLESLNLKVQH
jgi:hypothetical protein